MCGFFGYILRENVWEGEYNTKKDLENQVKHLMGRNSSLVFENTKLKEIIQHYENFIHMTYS